MGDIVSFLGASNGGKQRKNREMGWVLAIDSRRLNILHTTTNRKQVAGKEGTMKGRREDGEARGKHDSIVLGSITVEWRLKTKMKLLSLLFIFFSVLLWARGALTVLP